MDYDIGRSVVEWNNAVGLIYAQLLLLFNISCNGKLLNQSDNYKHIFYRSVYIEVKFNNLIQLGRHWRSIVQYHRANINIRFIH